MGADKIAYEIDKNNLKGKAILTGFVSDNELPILYSNAKAFLFPTYYEGFGLPIIEAMSYETPVVTGNIGASPEVAGGFAELVNPFDVGSIAQGICKVALYSEKQIEEAKEYSKKFTWNKCVSQTVDVYRNVLGK